MATGGFCLASGGFGVGAGHIQRFFQIVHVLGVIGARFLQIPGSFAYFSQLGG